VINFDTLAEQRILEAIERGDFNDLPGSGQPIDLNTDTLVPPEVRVANRILKNAGLAPPEILERRDLAELEGAVGRSRPGAERLQLLGRLALLRTQLEARKYRRGTHASGYAAKVVEKLARRASGES
jgi:hypothetical protein